MGQALVILAGILMLLASLFALAVLIDGPNNLALSSESVINQSRPSASDWSLTKQTPNWEARFFFAAGAMLSVATVAGILLGIGTLVKITANDMIGRP